MEYKSLNTINMSPEDISPEDLVIVCMGCTGAGKSTFIDLLNREEGGRMGEGLRSVTHQVEATHVLHPQSGKRVVLVDTPAFDHTDMDAQEAFQLVTGWLEKMYKLKIKLVGIVYLHPITDPHMRARTLRSLRMFECLCHDFAIANVMLTTTMWEGEDLQVGIDREKELISDYWQLLIGSGATVDRLNAANYDEAWRVVHGLIRKRHEIDARIKMAKKLAKMNSSFGGRVQKFFTDLSRSSFDDNTSLCPSIPLGSGSPINDILDCFVAEVVDSVAKMNQDDIQLFINYLDLVLDEATFTATDLQNRILTLLSRIAVSNYIYPEYYILQPIKYDPDSIAEGGFGTVHQALNRTVCVKVMKQASEEALKLCVKELILWSRLSHPNILPFFGIFLQVSRLHQKMCLVSPWINNGNLTNYAAKLVQKDRMLLLSDVADGLVYLHQLGIVHSDIKGQNVLVSDEGRAMITDFGISHIATDVMKQTTQSPIAHSANFSAPEILEKCFSGSKIRPETPCDIWSFGCLCYEILTRKMPFDGLAILRIRYLLCEKQVLPTRPSSSEDGYEEIDDKAWALIIACWVFDPLARPDCQEIQKMVAILVTRDDRSAPQPVKKPKGVKRARKPNINLNRVEQVLREIQVAIQQARLAKSVVKTE